MREDFRCSKCGHEVELGGRFCRICGSGIQREPPKIFFSHSHEDRQVATQLESLLRKNGAGLQIRCYSGLNLLASGFSLSKYSLKTSLVPLPHESNMDSYKMNKGSKLGLAPEFCSLHCVG
jgi:hypothetical protein